MQLEPTGAAAATLMMDGVLGQTPVDAPLPTIALCAGMTVLTLAGEIAAEDLVPGARIITRDSGAATLRKVSFARLTSSVIRFKAGSLGHTRPDHDTRALPGTLIHLRDWRAQALRRKPAASIAAEDLIDGEFIAAEPATTSLVVTLTFDRPHVIYADGLEIAARA
jgi:hypothetical protein